MGERIIGILGGMGPEATADLFYRIIRATPVEKDQDHVRTIIYSNSKVPDRTPAVLGEGENPVPEMLMAARKLEGAGADFLIVPCNTAHYFIEELRRGVGIPILHMIELTADEARKAYPAMSKAGLIATDGTVRSGLYEESFGKTGIEIVTPTPETQSRVMRAIYGHIKTGDLETGRRLSLEAAEALIGQGAEMIVCGCTEISLVLKDGDISVPVVDPLQVLAKTAVSVGLGERES